MPDKNPTMLDIDEQARLSCQSLETMFDEHMAVCADLESYDPMELQDTEIMPKIVENAGLTYPFLNQRDLQVAIAILNASVYHLETKLRLRGFKPSPRQGVVAAMTYRIVSGYWYRQDQHWFSIDPLITIDVDPDELPEDGGHPAWLD